MKNKTSKTLLALSCFIISAAYCPTPANASSYSTTVNLNNVSLNFTSTDPNDIYFFPDQKNSYSQVKINSQINDDYLIDGWGNTSASLSYGTADNGSSATTTTTANSITTSAGAFSSYGQDTFSSETYGAHWINFYTYNPLTVTIQFDYNLNSLVVEDIPTTGSTYSQIEARFYASADGTWDPGNSSVIYDSILINLDDPLSDSITFSHDFSDMTKKYGRFEILAYSSADVNPVPIPGAVWLLGSGLIGMLGFRQSRRK